MKYLVLLVAVFVTTSAAAQEVSTRVCEYDGNAPFDGRDIMVGTKLTIIVNSSVAEEWGGSLAVADANRDYGVLSARGPEPNHPNSCLAAAGVAAGVYDWTETGIAGFDLYTGYEEIEIGDWFIIDYTATAVGSCEVGFYEHAVSPTEPVNYLDFGHVRTRNFNSDTSVDFIDFAIFASYWQTIGCGDPNWCEGTDLDFSGSVDVNDLGLFVDYWLERTE
ncbi:MAG: hypothetical protein ACYSR5_00515 [Planctomycetota bacterium]|jgi:hypothetical protein